MLHNRWLWFPFQSISTTKMFVHYPAMNVFFFAKEFLFHMRKRATRKFYLHHLPSLLKVTCFWWQEEWLTTAFCLFTCLSPAIVNIWCGCTADIIEISKCSHIGLWEKILLVRISQTGRFIYIHTVFEILLDLDIHFGRENVILLFINGLKWSVFFKFCKKNLILQGCTL